MVVDGRRLGIQVVLADEDDGHPEQARELERLVERALVDRAIAEERNGDSILAAVLRRECRSGGDRQPGGNDPHPADHPEVLVGHVHRTALAAVTPEARPMSSPAIASRGTPRAIAWPWLR